MQVKLSIEQYHKQKNKEYEKIQCERCEGCDDQQ